MNQYELANILKDLSNKVYFGVHLIEHDGITSPRYWDGNQYKYIGYNEAKCDIAYIREQEDMELRPSDIGGCAVDYEQVQKLRVVIFKRDFKGGKNAVILKAMQLLSDNDIVVKRVISEPNKLLKQEGSYGSDIVVSPKNLYIGFDIELTLEPSCCDEEINICEQDKTNCI